jgi:hypothetical protein
MDAHLEFLVTLLKVPINRRFGIVTSSHQPSGTNVAEEGRRHPDQCLSISGLACINGVYIHKICLLTLPYIYIIYVATRTLLKKENDAP